jgi:O-antigen ligase
MFFIIILGGVGVSLMTYYYYGQLIGEVARISQYVSKDENYISPLALSYCAVLGITAGLSFLLTNKVSKMTSIYLILAIFSCFIPFFLGASRGALIAITVPFLLYFLFSLRFTDKIRFVVLSALFLLIVVFSTSYFGTGIFDRMIGLSDAIDQGSSSAIRLEMWRYGFVEQFLNNPIFGNSLQLDSVSHHPHNIFVEVLLSTGIIGFIPFIGFIVFVFRKIIVIIKKRPQYFWLTSVFLIGFMQNMFSGAIWGASWFAMGAAIILGFDVENIKYEK